MSRGYTNVEKTLAGHYAPGDVVVFHGRYRRLGVENGDELRMAGVDGDAGIVSLRGAAGDIVEWLPRKLAARSGGMESYRSEQSELRAGDRIRWTRNDASLGLVNSQTADVTEIGNNTVTFRLEDNGPWN